MLTPVPGNAARAHTAGVNALPVTVAGLLGFGSCLPALPTATPEKPTVTACKTDEPPLVGDVDGDGRADTVAVVPKGDSAFRANLVICFANGRVFDDMEHGPAAPLKIGDVNGDGDAEVLRGSVDAEATRYEVLRWTGTTLASVNYLAFVEATFGSEPWLAFGCGPDGRVVGARVDWTRRQASVVTYTVTETNFTTATRRVAVPAGADRATYVFTLAPPCDWPSVR